MSTAAEHGHTAFDPTAKTTPPLFLGCTDDEERGAFARAALALTKQQTDTLEWQVSAIAAKLALMIEQGRSEQDIALVEAKFHEAEAMRDAAIAEEDRWQADVNERAGF